MPRFSQASRFAAPLAAVVLVAAVTASNQSDVDRGGWLIRSSPALLPIALSSRAGKWSCPT